MRLPNAFTSGLAALRSACSPSFTSSMPPFAASFRNSASPPANAGAERTAVAKNAQNSFRISIPPLATSPAFVETRANDRDSAPRLARSVAHAVQQPSFAMESNRRAAGMGRALPDARGGTSMKTIPLAITLVALMLMSVSALAADDADNSKRNVADRNEASVTPGDQGSSDADIAIT